MQAIIENLLKDPQVAPFVWVAVIFVSLFAGRAVMKLIEPR